MKDEIKEKFYSLEELKRTIDCYDGYVDNEEVYYFIGALRFAYDYITNLQEELEEEKRIEQKSLETITNLQEEVDGIKDNFKIQLEYDEELENKITNLQENARGQVNDYFKDKYADEVLKNAKLQEENEKLKVDKETIKRWYKLCKSRNEKAIEYNNQVIKDTKDFYRPTSDVIYSGDTLIDIAMQNINILNGGDEDGNN